LDSSARGRQTRNGRHISFSFTHREIGEFIGTTREAVSRTLTYFKNQHFIEIHGSDLTIQNRMGLENLVSV
jgi:CRP/FNR family cyclic AMP-dependent transcriptional regulator